MKEKSNEQLRIEMSEENEAAVTRENKGVIIIDGMAVVNRMNKGQDIKTCKDFSDKFNQIILQGGSHFDEIRLIFDR